MSEPTVPDISAANKQTEQERWQSCQLHIYSAITAGLISPRPQSEDDLVEVVKRFANAVTLNTRSPYYSQTVIALRDELGIKPAVGKPVAEQPSGIELKRGAHPWLNEAVKDGVSLRLWDTYRLYLSDKKKRSNSVIRQLDVVTDALLDLMPDPRPGAEPRTTKGLLIGDVQSGKTQTYMALMNKAADYGYRFFVVLTSDNERLRRQTQERVDTDFTGNDSHGNRIGVGLLRRSYMGIPDFSVLTDASSDFKTGVSSGARRMLHPQRGRSPFVAVLKKNTTVLRAFQEWVGNQSTDVPMLIIDDESDYASINTSKKGQDRTAVNKLIGEILADSNCRAYVAVTATPFANIFIDDEERQDLFPEDFIYELDSPTEYLGAKQLFGDLDEGPSFNGGQGKHFVRRISQAEIDPWLGLKQHKNDRLGGNGLDSQLRHAINTFIVACAVDNPDGRPNNRRSMLIHVSRFVDIQQQVADRVFSYMRSMKEAVRANHPDSDSLISGLKEAYETEYLGLRDTTWAIVRQRIGHYLDGMIVRLENTKSKLWNEEHGVMTDRRYDYQIFVGGNSLSRGMTLPGLTVSFFYRHVTAADTLLQMGRWFGYRQGYEDLLRIWLLPETIYDFRYSAQVIEDLRARIESMHQQGLTPKQFGLMIRKNPSNGVRITSAAKSRNAELHYGGDEFNLAATNLESVRLSYDSIRIRENDAALQKLMDTVQSAADDSSKSTIREQAAKRNGDLSTVVYKQVPIADVLTFLTAYRAGYGDRYFGNVIATYRNDSDEFAFSMAQQYALTQQSNDRLHLWDVIFEVSGGGEDFSAATAGSSLHPPFSWIGTTRRSCTVLDPDKSTMAISGRSLRLAGSSDVRDYVLKFGDAEECRRFERENGQRKANEIEYYRYVPRPCLFLYMVNPVAGKNDVDSRLEFEQKQLRHSLAAKIVIPQDQDAFDPDDKNGTVEMYWNTVQQRLDQEQKVNRLNNLEALIQQGDSDAEED